MKVLKCKFFLLYNKMLMIIWVYCIVVCRNLTKIRRIFCLVPDHLRTKYEPEVEDKESVLSATASTMTSESTQVLNFDCI